METFFIRLMRGTTLSGLTCMKPIDGLYIRPLLEMSKNDIVGYLDTHKIPYLIDPTNESDEYLRNRIRLHVLPALQNADPRFTNNFFRTLEHLQQAEEVLDLATQENLQRCRIAPSLTTQADPIEGSERDNNLEITALLSNPSYLIKRILLAWLIEHKVPFTPSDGFLNEMIRFIKQPATKKQHPLHEQWMLCKNNNVLAIQLREN